MKILFVNWAPLWRGAQAGGGVNVYVQAMASALAQRGHQVSAVNAGYSYDALLRPRLRRARLFQGIKCYEIINSPIIAPGFFNAHKPLSDVQETHIEAVFQRLLDRLQPDIVHFNNIEGFSGHCIPLAKAAGARVIYSLHNYHPLCNQVNLLYQNRTPCTDFQQGQRCVDCLPAVPPRWRQQLRRRIIYYIRNLPQAQRLRRIASPSTATLAAAATPVRAAVSAQQFRQRRTELVACLNQADLLLAVSSWVRKVYVEYGLQPDKVRVNAIGSAIAALGRARPARPPKPAQTPLRLVFMGVADIYKGLPLLLQALAQLEDAELKQIDLALYAREIDRLEPAWRPLQTRLAALHIQDGYRYTDIPELLADRDLGVVAPIWWDNAPQVVFELLALGVPVLGARIGGIPDFVSDGRNGLLFEPDNAADLAAKLRQALREPDFINRMRAGIQPMKTLTEHADELEVFYSGHRD